MFLAIGVMTSNATYVRLWCCEFMLVVNILEESVPGDGCHFFMAQTVTWLLQYQLCGFFLFNTTCPAFSASPQILFFLLTSLNHCLLVTDKNFD